MNSDSPLNPQILGQADDAHLDLLDRFLAETGGAMLGANPRRRAPGVATDAGAFGMGEPHEVGVRRDQRMVEGSIGHA
jgi:hypothetical protein